MKPRRWVDAAVAILAPLSVLSLKDSLAVLPSDLASDRARIDARS
jgi:hypothetical protein